MTDFAAKTVLLSGSTGGFGRALAERLAAAGARLVLSDLDPAPLAEQAAAVGALAQVAGDITDPGTARRAVAAALEGAGRLDIAINNAGIATPFTPLVDIDSALAARVIDVDVMGVFHALQAQLQAMRAQRPAGGAIVNIASVAGLVGAPGLGVYAAAKHAVIGLTRSAALEHARDGIRVNAVCPSFARSPMVSEALGRAGEAAERQLTRGIPMRRLAEVEEVVAAVLFAADPANGFMSGETLAVDGALTAG